VQVDPIKPILKPPGTKHLKLKCEIMFSTFAFKFNLRRYNEVLDTAYPYFEALDKMARPLVRTFFFLFDFKAMEVNVNTS